MVKRKSLNITTASAKPGVYSGNYGTEMHAQDKGQENPAFVPDTLPELDTTTSLSVSKDSESVLPTISTPNGDSRVNRHSGNSGAGVNDNSRK